jgi:hypothetical protein
MALLWDLSDTLGCRCRILWYRELSIWLWYTGELFLRSNASFRMRFLQLLLQNEIHDRRQLLLSTFVKLRNTLLKLFCFKVALVRFMNFDCRLCIDKSLDQLVILLCQSLKFLSLLEWLLRHRVDAVNRGATSDMGFTLVSFQGFEQSWLLGYAILNGLQSVQHHGILFAQLVIFLLDLPLLRNLQITPQQAVVLSWDLSTLLHFQRWFRFFYRLVMELVIIVL